MHVSPVGRENAVIIFINILSRVIVEIMKSVQWMEALASACTSTIIGCRSKKFTFAVSSPDEFLSFFLAYFDSALVTSGIQI